MSGMLDVWQHLTLHSVQVPSVGILTNGTSYLFYTCHHDAQPRLVCSEVMEVELYEGIEAQKALRMVLHTLRTMLQMFLDQKRAIEGFWSKRQQN